MTLDDVMAAERDGLLAELLFPVFGWIQVPPYVAVPDFDVLERTPTDLRTQHPIRIEELPGEQPGQAFVQVCPTLKYKFLWAHVDNDDYRSDYIEFLRQHHAMTLESLPSVLHVDHLYNRKRARAMELKFIRMILLPVGINTSHGAGYEKSRTKGRVGTPTNQRGIDEIVLMKLCGVPSPRKNMPLTPEMLAHVQRIAAMFGTSTTKVEQSIRTLMDLAAFRPPH
jgi:hypothetical protein